MTGSLEIYKAPQIPPQINIDYIITNSEYILSAISALHSPSPDEILKSMHLLRKYFSKTQEIYQNIDKLLSIFDDNNVFKIVTEFIESPNQQLSMEAIKFVIHFTHSNLEFAQRFIENRLFYIISNIISQSQKSLDQPESFEFFNESLQVIANLANLNVNVYINRCYQILPHEMLKPFLETKIFFSLERMAKIYFCFIKYSTTQNVLNTAISQICDLLIVDEHVVSQYTLCALIYYMENPSRKSTDLQIFHKSSIQAAIFHFLESEYEDDQSRAIRIIFELIKRKCINSFHAEMLFPFVENVGKPELQISALSSIYESIRNDIICDQSELLNFLISLSSRGLFERFSYYSFVKLAQLLIGIFYNMTSDDLNSFISKPEILIMFIKFLEIDDIEDGVYIITNLIKYLGRINFSKEMAVFFAENNGMNILKDLQNNEGQQAIAELAGTLVETLLPLLD